jgi:DNA mismatch repair protein MSH6
MLAYLNNMMQRSLESFFTKRTEVLKSTPHLLAETSNSPDSLKRKLEEPLILTPAKRIKPDSLTSLTCSYNSKASTSDGKSSKSISHDNLAPITLKLDIDTEFDFPWFTLPQHIKDSKGRRPDHPDYDSSTIYIPKEEKFTPCMAQYWEIKALHWDKILLFKMGKFYELFYQDAVAVQRLLDLNWMGDPRKAHIGFPEKTLDRYASILMENGYYAVVVEQTECTSKANNRKLPSGKKTMNREVTEIYSKATFGDRGEYLGSDPRYLLSFYMTLERIGFCMADCSTSNFVLGDCNLEEFQTILSQTRPVEVVYHPGFTPEYMIKILKNSPLPPVFSALRDSNAWSYVTLQEIFNLEVPALVNSLHDDAVKALTGCCSYLKKVMLSDSLLPFGQFVPYSRETFYQTSLIMDSKALEHLEILEARLDDKPVREGSLLHFLDKTTTSFGKRLFKRWLCAPLFQISEIEARLDAVEELSRNWDAVNSFDTQAKKLPDLERLLSRISTYCSKQINTAYYFEDMSSKKITEFHTLLDNLCRLEEIMLPLSRSFESFRLRKITCMESEGEFPELKSVCSEFYNRVIWKDGVPEPVPGAYPQFDYSKTEVEIAQKDLQDYLNSQRERLGCKNINFAHAKQRYELEIPKHVVEGKKKPSDYELTSARNGFERFYTHPLRNLVYKLEIAEEKLKEQMKPFVIQLLRDFYQHSERWRKAIMAVAELDCLCSLAKVVQKSHFTVTRPKFTSDDSQYLKISNLVHPVLAHNKPDFVSNDIQFSSEHNCMVLTGPNMGGKSTLLRQVAIAVIMAQIGSFVPAEEMVISPVDRIFTRLGAADSLLEGKSTFQVEMEEASKVFKQGTQRSLVIMDELGRGTSTYDGAALAFAYLKELTETLSPRTLFTTHYHMLISKIQNLPRVHLWHMNALVSSQDSVTFLYKLKEGACPSSYGLNVAKLAGVQRAVVSRASVKAKEVEKILLVKQVISSLTSLKISNPYNIRASIERL